MWLIFVLLAIGGKIQGVVYDAETEEPLPYVNVVVLNTELGTATDDNGRFYILNVPSGKYTIEVSCLGYQTVKIENVVVQTDQVKKLEVSLKPTTIEIAPVTVVAERELIKKEMVGTTYILRKEEIAPLPIEKISDVVIFQPSVANLDTAIHIRGGRATEVDYLIDNVSIIDPQSGEPALNLSKNIVNEVIFLPGGFDAEYGRAMSGVINLITERPKSNISGQIQTGSEIQTPYCYSFGYGNFHSLLHLPIQKRVRSIVSFDLMHTDDWDPRTKITPHQRRDDYAFYGKLFYTPSGKINLGVSYAGSRTQFDRYRHNFKFNLDNFRSDWRKSNLQVVNINYLPDTRKFFNITISRLWTNKKFGVREPGPYGILDDFEFKRYQLYKYPHGTNKNPFGVMIYRSRTEGDYPEYQDQKSLVMKTNIKADLQVHKSHEIKSGIEYNYIDLRRFAYLLSSDTTQPIADHWHYYPKEYVFYIQDNIDLEGLYMKIGTRYDYFSPDIPGISGTHTISPRIGCSFMITDRLFLKTNIGKYTQPPLYDYVYRYYNLLPFPSYLAYLFNFTESILGNPGLKPEKTISYEIGLQGMITKNLIANFNAFSKSATDLVGVRRAIVGVTVHNRYFNIEYADIKGIEYILDWSNPVVNGKISYSLSWAKGTSSYADDIYWLYYYENPDTNAVPPAGEFYLDFDQRHRIFIQGDMSLPLKSRFYILCYFGNGFPYTPPGPEGKYRERNILQFPFQKQIDCYLSKNFFIGKTTGTVFIEVLNVFNWRYQISFFSTLVPRSAYPRENFDDYISIYAPYYHPAADFNHDGIIVPDEEYKAYQDYISALDDSDRNFTPPRRIRIGISFGL
ncbi:MAG: TonB-dependent receptor [candidate division WOR-3 bacterium]